MLLPLLLYFAIVPAEDYKQAHADMAEINHVYNEDLDLLFDQIIYWDFNHKMGRWDVVDFRIIKDGRVDYSKEKARWSEEQAKLPFEKRDEEFKPQDQKDFEAAQKDKPEHMRDRWYPAWVGSPLVPKQDLLKGGYTARYVDGSGRKIEIHVNSLHYTHSMYDVEQDQRQKLPKEKRRNLFAENKDYDGYLYAR